MIFRLAWLRGSHLNHVTCICWDSTIDNQADECIPYAPYKYQEQKIFCTQCNSGNGIIEVFPTFSVY